MSQQLIIHRYYLVIERIKIGDYPNKYEIKKFLKDRTGIEMSDRTIDRLFKQLRVEFGIEIKYSRSRKGYFVEQEDKFDAESFFKFLEIALTAEFKANTLKDSKEAMKYISFDASVGFKGIEYLKTLFNAVKEHRIIAFDYYRYSTEQTTYYENLKPYMLKEYQNRWYVIAHTGKELKAFGLDRISNLQVKTETFKSDTKLNPSEKYENVIGLFTNGEPEIIVLSFSAMHGEYIKTLPLHKTQKILIDNDKELRIELFVVPNYELKQIILKYSDGIKVIEPQWLADEIKNILKQAVKKYE